MFKQGLIDTLTGSKIITAFTDVNDPNHSNDLIDAAKEPVMYKQLHGKNREIMLKAFQDWVTTGKIPKELQNLPLMTIFDFWFRI